MQIYANSRQVVLSEVVHRLEDADRPESRITLGQPRVGSFSRCRDPKLPLENSRVPERQIAETTCVILLNGVETSMLNSINSAILIVYY